MVISNTELYVYLCSIVMLPIHFADTLIFEFIGLRSKMYSLITHQKECDNIIQRGKRTAKGIAKSAIEHQLRYVHYKQCLFENKMTRNDMNLIRSQSHVLYVNNVRKIGLCNFDEKRF